MGAYSIFHRFYAGFASSICYWSGCLEILESQDLDLLYDTISKNILAFDDIVEFMKTSEEVQSEQSILVFLKENFDIEWSTFAQVNFRLIWLLNLGKIKKTNDGYLPE